MAHLTSIAEAFWRTLTMASSELPAKIQTALKTKVGTSDVSWALSLVLASWRILAQGNDEPIAMLKQTGAMALVKQLESMSRLLPESFVKALDAAEKGELAGAKVFLVGAFKDLMDLQVDAFVAWVTGTQFTQAGTALIGQYPQPTNGAGQPASEARPTQAPTSRADRFDRADFPVRRGAAAPTVLIHQDFSAPPPNLAPADIARAALLQAGWTTHDADRLMSGPGGQTGTFLQVRRILATYTSLKKTERMLFQKLIDETEEGFHKEDLASVSIADISDLRLVDKLIVDTGLQLYKEYKRLPIPDRMRVIKHVLANETGFTPAEMNATSLGKIDRKELE